MATKKLAVTRYVTNSVHYPVFYDTIYLATIDLHQRLSIWRTRRGVGSRAL